MRLLLSILMLQVAGVTICVAQRAIDQRQEIVIGGIKQVIWVKGSDINKPLFLFLHGGPGNSVMSYAGKFCDQLYDHFVVVHWDQRDAGETLKLNPSPEPLSLALFRRDTEQLVDSLLHRFNKSKLYIAGHSWGTALGFHLVRTHPSQIEAFIAIGSMINQLESEKIALDLMIAKAIIKKDSQAAQQLKSVQIPFQNSEQLYYHRKHLLEYSGSKSNLSKEFVMEWSMKWLPVFNEASKENLFESLPEAYCPVYFFAGRNDYQTNSTIAEHYYKTLKAPAKGFYWFEKTGHSIPSSSGKKMQQIILEKIFKDYGL
jgi:pimeloyl-ACP methyl ester carboxylesterase